MTAASDPSVTTKVQLVNQGNDLVVRAGGSIVIEAGATFNNAGGSSPTVGAHAVSSGEANAHTVSIATGLASIAAVIAQVVRGGNVITADAAVSASGGNVVVADGALTYVLTAGDVINWLVG